MAGLIWLLLTSPPVWAGTAGPPSLPTTSGSGAAVEGDVVSVNGGAVKLWGIDAPDVGQTCTDRRGRSYDCFEASKKALSRYIGQNQIECHIRGKDSHGQQIGTCGVKGMDLAALMTRDGWALAFQGLSFQYTRLEGEAQAHRRGLWSGRVEPPWIWRSLKTEADRHP